MEYKKEKSGETALSEHTRPSKELLSLFQEGYADIDPSKTTVLDFGAGKGRHSKALRDMGYSVYSYDPYNGAADGNPCREVSAESPNRGRRFGVVFTAFVLNVVDEDTMRDIVELTEHFTAKGGYTVHIVREDLRRLKGGCEITKKGTYQRDIPISQLTALGYVRKGKLFVKEKH